MPSELERAANRFRRDLLNNERQAASAMVEAYGYAWQRVSLSIQQIQQELDQLIAEGATESAEAIFRLNRYQSLRAQIEAELRRFGGFAESATVANQQRAIQAAGRNAAELVNLAAGPGPIQVPFDVLPTAALEDLVGFASDGSPLRVLFGEISGGVADQVTTRFAASLAAGFNPRVTARILRDAFGLGLARALTISRTETMRAYREATHRNYQRNADVIGNWIWSASLSTRTCAACWAMHGSIHPLSEPMGSHPNCRCTMIPQVKSWKELGYNVPDHRPTVERGTDAFARLSPADQEAILGKAAYAAYIDKAVSLEQFATERHSHDWGTTVQKASLRSILGDELAREYMRAE